MPLSTNSKRPAQKLVALAFVAVATTSFATGAMAEAPKGRCEIDEGMEKRAAALIKEQSQFVEDAIGKPGRKMVENMEGTSGCLPSLDSFGGKIFGNFPGFGGGFGGFGNMGGVLDSIIDAVVDAVCSAADDMLKDAIEGFNYSAGDPYGIFSVGIGGSTSGSSVDVGTYDIDKVVGEAVKGKWNDAKKTGTSQLESMKNDATRKNTPQYRGNSTQPKTNGSGITDKINEWEILP